MLGFFKIKIIPSYDLRHLLASVCCLTIYYYITYCMYVSFQWMREEGDFLRIGDETIKCRKLLKESDILQKRQDSGFGLFKTALKK